MTELRIYEIRATLTRLNVGCGNNTGCLFERASEHGICHGMSRWAQAFYAINLSC
jgi:hypothetical protein